MEPDCTPVVDGDGPVRVPAGCELLPAQPAVANPALGPVCGLRVMVVVDVSASIDAAAVRAVASGLVDALDGTGSSMAIVEFSTDAGVQVGYTVVDESSRGVLDGAVAGFGTGGSTNLEAGLAAAVAASPDLTVVVTDGVANASSGAGGHGGHPTVAVQDEAVHFAVAHADQLKAAGSRVFAVGVGNVDTSMLAAISGPNGGGDVASADYSLGGADAIAASLHTVASAGCAPSTSEEPGDFAVARAVGEFCNTSPITVPATGTFGVAAPYPSTITVSGADPVAGLVTVQLAGVGHTTPIDFDILLVGPTGANITLLSDAGGLADATGADLTFVDNAPAAGTPLVTGTYRPTNLGAATDSWPAPAPAPSGATTLATFTNTDPNGVWSLFVVDDEGVDVGTIAGGWCLTVFSDVATAETTATAVTSSPNPSVAGEDVTFTANVTSGGNPVTAGSVTFSEGTTTLGEVAPRRPG